MNSLTNLIETKVREKKEREKGESNRNEVFRRFFSSFLECLIF